MSSHQSLTEAYLAGFAKTGLTADQMFDTVRDSVQATSYRARALTRPVFLGRAEHQQLAQDMANVHDLIASIPNRFFGGDLNGFIQAVGMPPVQADAVLRCHRSTPVRLSRADLCMVEDGFKMIELNMGSTMAGFDNIFLNEGMLKRPFVRDFVAEHNLDYVDSVAELAHTVLTECKVPTGVRPMMAIADWPESYLTLEPQLHKSAEQLARHGLDPHPCHIGQLRFEDGAVWLEDRKVDIIYRLFTMTDLLEPEGPGLIDPVLAAVSRGEVEIFAPMDTYLFGSKGAMAILSDEHNRHKLTDDERTSIDRILPWTRMVRPGPVEVDGALVDMASYALEQRAELILKPTLLYGGLGVTPGWTTEPDEWRQLIEAAMDQPFVLQRRVHPVLELFPGDNGLEAWTLVWAYFHMMRGAGGLFIRGGKAAETDVVNMTQGATGTCCFLEL